MLQAKVGRRLAGREEDFLRNAEKALESLEGEFEEWLGQDIQKLISAGESYFRETDSNETFQNLSCAIHDLKGLGVTYNYPLVTSFAAALHGYIERHSPDEPPARRIVDAHIQAIRAVHSHRLKDSNNAVAQALLAELRALVNPDGAK